jgi:hypothetical protein
MHQCFPIVHNAFPVLFEECIASKGSLSTSSTDIKLTLLSLLAVLVLKKYLNFLNRKVLICILDTKWIVLCDFMILHQVTNFKKIILDTIKFSINCGNIRCSHFKY